MNQKIKIKHKLCYQTELDRQLGVKKFPGIGGDKKEKEYIFRPRPPKFCGRFGSASPIYVDVESAFCGAAAA